MTKAIVRTPAHAAHGAPRAVITSPCATWQPAHRHFSALDGVSEAARGGSWPAAAAVGAALLLALVHVRTRARFRHATRRLVSTSNADVPRNAASRSTTCERDRVFRMVRAVACDHRSRAAYPSHTCARPLPPPLPLRQCTT